MGGDILNPLSFFVDPYRLGGAPAFLTIDIAVCWVAFMVWVVFDAKRIGLGAKWGLVGLDFHRAVVSPHLLCLPFVLGGVRALYESATWTRKSAEGDPRSPRPPAV